MNRYLVTDNTQNEHVMDRELLMSLDAQQALLDEIGVGGLKKIKGTYCFRPYSIDLICFQPRMSTL